MMKHFSQQKGSIVVAISAALLFAVAATFAIAEYSSWSRSNSSKYSSMQILNAVTMTRDSIVGSLQNKDVLLATAQLTSGGSPVNTGLETCLGGGSCPATWSDLTLTDRASRKLTDASSSVGFSPYVTDASGAGTNLCSGFDINSTSTACPLRYELKWIKHSVTDEIVISGRLLVNQAGLIKNSADFFISTRIGIFDDPCLPGYPTPSPPFAAGSGTPANPYVICTGTQFNAIGSDDAFWNKHFVLNRDLDMSAFNASTYNQIGDWSTSFTGQLEGNNRTIANLNLDYSSGLNMVGLFSHVGSGAIIRNLKLQNFNIDVGPGTGGALAADVIGATIQNIEASGVVTSDAFSWTGGIIAVATDSTLDNLRSAINFPAGTSAGPLGGVVGSMGQSTLSRATYSGTAVVSGSGPLGVGFIGGIAGRLGAGGMISQSKNTGTLTVSNTSISGGVVGGMAGSATLRESAFSGFITSSTTLGSTVVGGLVGDIVFSGPTGEISNCYSKGSMTIISGPTPVNQRVGGLIGRVSGVGGINISNSYVGSPISVTTVSPRPVLGQLVFGTPSFSNVVYDGDLFPAAAPTPGVFDQPTVEMHSPYTFSGYGWSATHWNLTTSGQYLKLAWEP